ncbi:DUF3221 domain-containing protein [Bacillus thuringiensis]|uniref:DUF3221 domain-containing protein n=1 Tax=Bacillus thuringiensis TaxID=1428 RepID=UPI00125EA809|nr:DUF3221 domain-containing protein [Bacillus thuringiensis]KAB5624488.1 DUF3221 domain-containing protein [Bacillus thuringiensis]HDR5272032.1 DUF3221 domain-containing protein [Bacillus thuringiensis]
MFTTKQKLVTVATTLAVGCGFTFGLTPAFADSHEMSSNHAPISSIQKQEQTPFTGYVISVNSKYIIVANTLTKDEALSYQNDWHELVSQNKILRVPISNNGSYTLGEKLHVYAVGWTASLPPIAVMPTIEKVVE